jgi:SAM-dependent methyltransferase
MEWFTNWFGSPYYPILYSNRNESEAFGFVSFLFEYLNLKKDAKIVDLACGRGRHAKYFSSLGADVVGLDISKESITEAKLSENEHLRFIVHDMRHSFPIKNLDAIFNLFTSFGYFEKVQDNEIVFRNIVDSLKNGGLFVLDYLNIDYVIPRLISNEQKIISNIIFNIGKKVENGFIIKNINIIDGEKAFEFQEKVQVISLANIRELCQKVGLEIIDVLGDYQGKPYISNISERLIIICKNN